MATIPIGLATTIRFQTKICDILIWNLTNDISYIANSIESKYSPTLVTPLYNLAKAGDEIGPDGVSRGGPYSV